MIVNVIIVLLSFYMVLSNAVLYDYYTGKIASKQLIAYYKSKGILGVCTTDIEPCCATERRRVDGSCNNLNKPSRGTFFEPPVRILPALYYNGSYERKAESGRDLKLPRAIRRDLLCEGNTGDCRYTQAMTSYGIFMFLDFGSIHDIVNFVVTKPDCCTKKGIKEYECTPNFVSKGDSLRRLAGIKCLNLTRPLTYQSFGCTKDPVPAPIEQATSVFDLSQIYNFLNKGEKAIRTYHRGMIIMEVENGKTWPQKGEGFCPLNQAGETRCFANHPNVLVLQTLFVVWFMRLHNYFAAQLAKVNPCWDDDMLFYVARDMNIAFAVQVYLHEWLASLVGYDNLVKSGVISKHCGFRNIYDCTQYPVITLELTYINRWFHTAQDSNAKLFDEHGCYLQDFPLFNLTTRSGFLMKRKRMEYFTQGHFRQACGNTNDHCIDYNVADNGLPFLQLAVDIAASDLNKGRTLGLRPYIDYIYFCTGRRITCFDDLRGHIDPCKIPELQKCYDHVGDIDLLAGLWLEKNLKGGWIPRTLACLFNYSILKAIRGDRHWYENQYRPYPFTKWQLLEMRKASLAWLLCTVGDSVTEVQRNAFLIISPENPLVKCCDIPGINFEAWRDPDCDTSHCECGGYM